MIGQVNTVLVCGDHAFVTEIVAKQSKRRKRIRVSGSVVLADKVLRHLRATVLPLLDSILDELLLPRCNYEISVVNPGIASTRNTPLTISGYSADVAIALALLSVSLSIPLRDDYITTGHIASAAGQIRMVQSLDKKAQAVATSNLKHFVFPAGDNSTKAISPYDGPRTELELRNVGRTLQLHRVIHLKDVIDLAFEPSDILIAALQNNYYHSIQKEESVIAQHLSTVSFDAVLETMLLHTQIEKVRALFSVWVGYHVKNNIYPSGTGERLHSLLLALPQIVRHCKLRFPLIDQNQLLELKPLEGDESDFEKLLKANEGDINSTDTPKRSHAQTNAFYDKILDTILAELNESALTEKICAPLDAALARYQIPFDENIQIIIESFYRFLLLSVGELSPNSKKATITANALGLAERAYARDGCLDYSEEHSIEATREILERMVNTMCKERMENHVAFICQQAINQLDEQAKLALTKRFITRFRDALPKKFTRYPPERFANSWDKLLLGWLAFQSEMQKRFHTL